MARKSADVSMQLIYFQMFFLFDVTMKSVLKLLLECVPF